MGGEKTRHSYAHTYNLVYENHVTHNRLDHKIRALIHPRRAFHLRVHTLRHLQTMLNTQSLASKITLGTWYQIHQQQTLTRLGVLMRLWVLQRRILEFLWRPTGGLVRREALRCVDVIITPMRDVSPSNVWKEQEGEEPPDRISVSTRCGSGEVWVP